MRNVYLCNACLAQHERAAGVTLETMDSNPAARCACGALAQNVVDLDSPAERLEQVGCFTRAVDDLLRERRRMNLAVRETPPTLRLLAAIEEIGRYKQNPQERDRLVRAGALLISVLDTLDHQGPARDGTRQL